jgi:hypothetical protein
MEWFFSLQIWIILPLFRTRQSQLLLKIIFYCINLYKLSSREKSLCNKSKTINIIVL